MEWFEKIPNGTLVCLQGNDMVHEDHRSEFKNLQDFICNFPFTTVLYVGQKEFTYPDWSFKRFMLIGKK